MENEIENRKKNDKQQVFYIHGGEPFIDRDAFITDLKERRLWDPHGEDKKIWSQSLREFLGEDYEVFTPKMPNKQYAQYSEWQIWFERHFDYLHDNLILIGYSLGGIFLMKYLNENILPVSIKAIFLVASPFADGSLDEVSGKSTKHFGTVISQLPHNIQKVRKVFIFHSQDDPVAPFAEAIKYKEVLPEAELVSFADRGHFRQPEFPELVEKIKSL